ncbi:hypothetical protein M885DRAFT_625590 [Pelagophyceae sp. CCMP2097]|nr:hypothetical protein M885DRAFT_625590 [Pelagophyceae sp. CCMP2097]
MLISTLDDNQFYDGSSEASSFPGAVDSVQPWLGYNGCATLQFPEAAREKRETVGASLDLEQNVEGDDTEVFAVDDCGQGSSVTLWKMLGGGHDPKLTPAYQTHVVNWLFAADDVPTAAQATDASTALTAAPATAPTAVLPKALPTVVPTAAPSLTGAPTPKKSTSVLPVGLLSTRNVSSLAGVLIVGGVILALARLAGCIGCR